MTPELLMAKALIRATLHDVLPGKFDSPEAEVMLLAIGLQESEFRARKQVGGPAHGFWQFERGGGVLGVLTNGASKPHALAVCHALGVEATTDEVYKQLLTNDTLACAFARLLLYTDPRPLPKLGDVDGAWLYYAENWRPGLPHPDKWPENYAKAIGAL